jgi:hypothetical protein
MALDSFRRSRSFKDAPAGLAYILDAQGGPFGGGVLRVAMQRREEDNEWTFLAASLLMVGRRVETLPPRAYPGLYLAEEWLTSREIGTRLTARENTVFLAIRGPHESTQAFDYAYGERCDTQEELPGGSEFAETSVYFEASGRRQPDMDHRPAVGMGLPAYRTLAEAAREWCFAKHALHPGDFHERGRFYVIMPEVRARIVDPSIRNGVLTFEVVTNRSTSGEAHVVFGSQSVWGMDASVDRGQLTPLKPGTNNVASVEVPADASQVNIFVIDANSSLVTHYRGWRQFLDVEEAAVTSERVAESEIAAGENDQVEFKVWPTKSDLANVKVKEMVKTVVAFANTSGGRLYVGVDDDGVPQSLAPLAHYGHQKPEDLLDAIRSDLDRAFRNGIVPVPRFTISGVQIHGNSILVVRVEPGTKAPYSTTSNEVYIRKGSSNRRPDAHSELKSLFSSESNDRYGEKQ